jgi:glutathione S-transferase
MILYGASLSPFVRKTLAYAAEKGLALDLVPAGMGRGGPEFAEASPLGKMPAFRDPGADGGRDFTISDSSAIIHYLEAKFPEPNMIPLEPADRARTVWYEEFGDTIVAKLSGAAFFNRIVAPRFLRQPGDEAAAAAAIATDMPTIMDYLERVAPEPDGFLVAGRLTLADLAVASPFVNLAHCDAEPTRDRWPRAMAYVDAILARPSFAGLIAEERRFLAATAA